MKLVTYVDPAVKGRRVGILKDEFVVDLNRAYAALLVKRGEAEVPYRLAQVLAPTDMIEFLRGGERTLQAARETREYAGKLLEEEGVVEGPNGEMASYELGKVEIKAPIPRPGKIVHTAGNFREHAKEAQKAGWEFPIPQWISFLKNPDAVIGPDESVVYPRYTKELDYELEMGIVMGRKCKDVTPEGAWNCIAGYTIFNDITARDIQRIEMKNGLLNLGKNMDTFAPLGPCIALKDEIEDPHKLKMELRVNGEPRQQSGTWNLSVTIPEIISRYSVITLYPGDIVTTGTVSGVAAFRDDPFRYYLKAGDVIEAEIEKIGILRNSVIAEEKAKEIKPLVPMG